MPENKHNSVARFNNRVENYIKYRPGYPKELIPFLEKEIGFSKGSVIGDIGSGTGISTEPFLKNGNTVYGIEPNELMRQAAEQLLTEYKTFNSINGTAEDTTLGNNEIDMILAGQAFHWFDREAAKVEFKRILKPNGYVVLMWNKKDNEASPFMFEYEGSLLEKLSTDYKEIRHEGIDDKIIAEFFENGYNLQTFPNIQVLDLEGLIGRYLSSSYAPLEGPEYHSALETIKGMFDKYNKEGKIEFTYKTQIYYGKIK